ncbi:MAG: hypothetical protein KAH56_04255 [Candidatus Krumholzibacteria bacterium]|nr:hypothetical protein [Candidatus Krumholzibacteria bacterium]
MKIGLMLVFYLVIATNSLATNLLVYPDGSGIYPTIEDAVDAAMPGDVILLQPGVFTGPGNRGIDIEKVVDIQAPDGCVIDCEGLSRAFQVADFEVSFQGLTIRNGSATTGGAINAVASQITLADCVFEDNFSSGDGGAIYADESNIQTNSLIFSANRAGGDGGGFYLTNDSVLSLYQSTMIRNGAHEGNGVYLEMDSSCSILNSIIVYGVEGSACSDYYSNNYIVQCTDVYGNRDGDWIHSLQGMNGTNGNFSIQPLLCDPMADPINVDLTRFSPCADADGCGLVGAGAYDSGWYYPHYCVSPDGYGMFATIQDAFDAATARVFVLLEDGVYTGTGNRDLNPAGKSMFVTSRSESAETCILDCQSILNTDEHRVLILDVEDGGGLDFSDLTFRGGNNSGPGGAVLATGNISVTFFKIFFDGNLSEGFGGAIRIDAESTAPADVGFFDCEFSGNQSWGGGAINGMYWVGSVNNCLFDANSATSGGAISSSSRCPTISHSTFIGNTATSYGGAILYNNGNSSIMEDCILKNNTAVYGGGIHMLGGNHEITSTWFEANIATDTGGAVDYMTSASDKDVTVTGCTFLNNAASSYGSVMNFDIDVNLQVTTSTFHGNTTVDPDPTTASQIHMDRGNAGVTTSTISGGIGGPLFLVDNGGIVSMDRTNVWGNDAGDYVGPIAGLNGMLCNMSVDPIFCDAAASDLTLRSDSECLAINNICNVQYGVWGEGCSASSGVESLPTAPGLALSNHPNPFNPMTTIRFDLPQAGMVSLSVYDVRGRALCTLGDGFMAAGAHEIAWNGRDDQGRQLGTGVYFVRLVSGGEVVAHRMALLK